MLGRDAATYACLTTQHEGGGDRDRKGGGIGGRKGGVVNADFFFRFVFFIYFFSLSFFLSFFLIFLIAFCYFSVAHVSVSEFLTMLRLPCSFFSCSKIKFQLLGNILNYK